MALSLSTLTSPSNSSVLEEINTTADFLEGVPLVKNLARGTNAGSSAKQDVALNQPRALPLIKNPQGNLGGYLYIPNVSGNYATGPSVTIGANQTWEAEVDMVITQFDNHIMPMGGGNYNSGFGLLLYSDGGIRSYSKTIRSPYSASGITLGTPLNMKYGYGAIGLYVKINDVIVSQTPNPNQSSSITHTLELAQNNTSTHAGNYAIQKAKLTVNSSVVFDCDFNGSTSIRHGDTKFNCVGGPVSLTRASNDPATVIKKSVLRFSTATSGLKGLFANQIDGGYMFAAFSVLGTGVASGEASGRVFSINKTGGVDYASGGAIFSAQNGIGTQLRSVLASTLYIHLNLYDDANGDILHESKLIQGEQFSRINNADLKTNTNATVIESDEFNIGVNEDGIRVNGENAALDLEFLALFPSSITDDQADSVRNYINNRNNVFSLVDNGYYFFDPQKATFTGNFTGANTLDGYITGSDLGDTDVRSNLTLVQATLNDQPSTDGYTISFNDSAEHLEFENSASQNLSGWQVCGTSLGTFAYRVQGAVTELNLLGNLGHANTRQVGQSYGILLLPESATTADLNAARKLLIDRGGLEKVPAVSMFGWFYARADIVNFQNIDLSAAVSCQSTWELCSSMISFGVTDIQNCNNFVQAWKGTNSLTSFPAGAKLGTSAQNVNFQSAWESSGLTSFSTQLPTAINVRESWENCSSLTSFNSSLPLVTNAMIAFAGCSSLTSFNTPLPQVTKTYRAWANCSSMTDFSSDVFANWNPSSISSGIFDLTWDGCTSLTADSVENILTSIDASGQYATSTGASGGSALADAGIDIDYNTATGSLSAATNSAVTSLKSKGWVIVVNGVTL